MQFKDQILKAIWNEVRIIKHLYTKLPEDSQEFRPAENMRSMKDLLAYLTWCGAGSVVAYAGNYTAADTNNVLKMYRERAQKFTPEQFEEAMDDQMQVINEVMQDITDNDLKNKDVTVIWGETMKLGDAILNTALKYFTAYRMQLFIYEKMAGASQLNTMNCWVGMDPPSKNN